jgi:hypothetical protein
MSNAGNTHVMERVAVGSILKGDVYERHQLRAVTRGGAKVIEDVSMGNFKVAGCAFDLTSRQEKVILVGQSGADNCRLFCCSLNGFAVEFRPLPPPEPPPEKAAGYSSQEGKQMGGV